MSRITPNEDDGEGLVEEGDDEVQEPTPTAAGILGASSSSSSSSALSLPTETEDEKEKEEDTVVSPQRRPNRPPETLAIHRSPTIVVRSSSSKNDKEDASKESLLSWPAEDADEKEEDSTAAAAAVRRRRRPNLPPPEKLKIQRSPTLLRSSLLKKEDDVEQGKEEDKDDHHVVEAVASSAQDVLQSGNPDDEKKEQHEEKENEEETTRIATIPRPPELLAMQRSTVLFDKEDENNEDDENNKNEKDSTSMSRKMPTTLPPAPPGLLALQRSRTRVPPRTTAAASPSAAVSPENGGDERSTATPPPLRSPRSNNNPPPAPVVIQRTAMKQAVVVEEVHPAAMFVADRNAQEDTTDVTAKTADANDSIPCRILSPRNNPPAIATMQRSAIKRGGGPNPPHSEMRTTTAAATAPFTSFSSTHEHHPNTNNEHENTNNTISDNSNTNHCRSNSSSYESFDELINNSNNTHDCDNDKETVEGMVGTNTANANANAIQDPDTVQEDASLLLREPPPLVLPAAANSVSSSSSSSNDCNISNLMDSNTSNPHHQSNTTTNDTAVDDDTDANENNEDHGRSNNNEESDDPLRDPLLPSSTRTLTSTDTDANDKDITLTLCCYCGSTNKKTVAVNHNVLLNLVLSILYGISNSLWNGTAYLVYIKKLAHGSNKPVGGIEAVSGLASLVCALPIGYAADTYGRAIVIKVGSVVFMVTSLVQIGILEYAGTVDDEYDTNDDDAVVSNDDNTTSTNFMFDFHDMFDTSVTFSDDDNTNIALWLMGGIMIFWGFGDGIIQGPCQALYADSTPQGNRSKYFTYQFVCYLIASSVGPLVSIVMFQTLGDNWDMYHLKLVIYVGLILEVFNSILMCFFDDSKALDEAVANENEEGRCDTTNVGQENNDATGENQDDMYDASCISENSNMAHDVRADDEHDLLLVDANNNVNTNILTDVSNSITITFTVANDDEERTTVVLQKRREWIPYIVFISGLISSLGSGMTVKFFPLFFKDEVGMTPSQVQIIYTLVPIVMAIFGTFATKLATDIGFGRVQTMIAFWIVGISLLLSMVVFKSYLDVHPIYLVPIYVLRTALMNSVYPLENSILMDYVPKNQRARWKSLDSVASFGWCGSAAFGGWLADNYDYTHTFLCTAVFQIVALCIWCLLLPLVPRIEGTSSNNGHDHISNGSDCRESNSNVNAISSNNNAHPVDGGATDSRCDATNYVGDVDERRNSNATRITVDGDTLVGRSTIVELSEPLLPK